MDCIEVYGFKLQTVITLATEHFMKLTCVHVLWWFGCAASALTSSGSARKVRNHNMTGFEAQTKESNAWASQRALQGCYLNHMENKDQ